LSGRRKRMNTETTGRKNPIMNQVLNERPICLARFPAMVGKIVRAEINMDVNRRIPI
jgi:hypothetical protein